MATRQLRGGDALRSHDGQWLAVEALRDTGRAEVVVNARVAEYHTYFVGRAEWGFGVWLRASCQTDLANRFPAQVVCNWLGNSLAVAREPYLQVTEYHFEQATSGVPGGAKAGAASASTGRSSQHRVSCRKSWK